MSSVTSFSVVLDSVDAITASGSSASLVSGTPTVDFARFNGLQTLLDMNDIPAGTYTSVQITLGAGQHRLPEHPVPRAPTIANQTATLTSSTINIPLASPC